MLQTLPAESVQTCVTSPPYWLQRDYGHPAQIGLQDTPEKYTAAIVEVMAEVWRVLKPDGTLWLNLADSYARNGGVGHGEGEMIHMKDVSKRMLKIPAGSGLKVKDLVGVPWRVAFALQSAGWYLRSDIIWYKPNPKPESVTDRPTKSHEYLFLLSKQEKYLYNAKVIAEPVSDAMMKQIEEGYYGQATKMFEETRAENASDVKRRIIEGARLKIANGEKLTRNKHDVWILNAKGYRGEHTATFPEELPSLCILAGSNPGDMVLDPFGGSGTTGRVAIGLGRRAILIELNPKSAHECEERCSVTAGFHL